MKKFIYPALLVLPAIILSFCTSSPAEKLNSNRAVMQAGSQSIKNDNVVVLELFTSQGCSSCPPADKLLSTYANRQNVIVLSYHVDYWDRLGWKDPYSSKTYTQRQYDYASALHADVYTPQLVVNGETAMVGSDAPKIENTVNRFFLMPAKATLLITKAEAKEGKVFIDYTVSGNTANDMLNIAIAQKKVVTQVQAGENGGATLTGYNVVTHLNTFNAPASGAGSQEISMQSPSVDAHNICVIAFLQDKITHKISGAAEASF